MKRYIIYSAIIFAMFNLASCRKEASAPGPGPGPASGEGMVFTASIEKGDDTKTTVAKDGGVYKISWESTDSITINGIKYVATPNDPATSASFKKKNAGDTDPTVPFHAFYPSDIQSADKDNTGTLPATQTYGKFCNVPMYANSSTQSLHFKCITGILAVKVKVTEMATVKKIRVSSSNKAMSGAFTVENGVAKLGDSTTVAKTVILDCGEGVSTTSDGVVFYIAIPALTYRDLKIELSSDGTNYTSSMTTKAMTDIVVANNTVYPITFADNSEFEGALSGIFIYLIEQYNYDTHKKDTLEIRKFRFSKGNLQYQASTNTFRFAAHQYDIIDDESNLSVSSTYSGWIDLFSWATSGWNSGAKAYQPWSVSGTNSDFYPGGISTNSDIVGVYDKADWGVYNKISNGGNKAGMWRVLSSDEYNNLLNKRKNATNLRTAAQIQIGENKNVNGYILFPDGFSKPSDINIDFNTKPYSSNQFSLETWERLEAMGAVFFPATGYRKINSGGELSISNRNEYCRYHSSTVDKNGTSINPFCYSETTGTQCSTAMSDTFGMAVRLVQVVTDE